MEGPGNLHQFFSVSFPGKRGPVLELAVYFEIAKDYFQINSILFLFSSFCLKKNEEGKEDVKASYAKDRFWKS